MKSTLFAFLFATFAFATIVHIPADYLTIQDGIDNAAEGDTVLVAPGTYLETIRFNGTAIMVGSLFITSGDTGYISSTVIDANHGASVVTFDSGEDSTAVLSGFTLTHGFGVSNDWQDFIRGGGISCQNESSPKLTWLNIMDNEAYGGEMVGYGGGVTCRENSCPIIDNVLIQDNFASSWWFVGAGGAVACLENSNPVIRNSIIRSNYSNTVGGGIFADSSHLIIQSSLIESNSSNQGGGIWLYRGATTFLQGTTIRLNNADQDGGGIYLSDSSSVEFSFEERCSIYQNHAARGWDLYLDAIGPLPVVLDTFSVNLISDLYAYPAAELTFSIQHYLAELFNADLYASPTGDDDHNGLTPDEPLKTISRALASIYVSEDFPHSIHLAPGSYSVSGTGEQFPFYWLDNLSLTSENPDDTVLDLESSGNAFDLRNIDSAFFSGFSVVYGNHWDGGAFHLENASPVMNDLILQHNHSNYGGAVFCENNSNPVLQRVLITDNTTYSHERGGGIYAIDQSHPVLINVTISNNTADEGGAIYLRDNADATIINSVIWGNSGIEIESWDSTSGVIVSYSTIEDGLIGLAETNLDITWLDGNLDSDPQLVNPDSSDYHLSAASPCIDTADPDLDGDGSPWYSDPDDRDPDGTRLDMGALFFDQSYGCYELEYDFGDVNDDGNVDILDVVMVVGFIIDQEIPTPVQICCFDCWQDGQLNVLDLVCFISSFLPF